MYKHSDESHASRQQAGGSVLPQQPMPGQIRSSRMLGKYNKPFIPACGQALQSMVKRAALERSLASHAGALARGLHAELAAVKRRFEGVRRGGAHAQAGRAEPPRLSGAALAASHLIRRLTLTWAALQARQPAPVIHPSTR